MAIVPTFPTTTGTTFTFFGPHVFRISLERSLPHLLSLFHIWDRHIYSYSFFCLQLLNSVFWPPSYYPLVCLNLTEVCNSRFQVPHLEYGRTPPHFSEPVSQCIVFVTLPPVIFLYANFVHALKMCLIVSVTVSLVYYTFESQTLLDLVCF